MTPAQLARKYLDLVQSARDRYADADGVLQQLIAITGGATNQELEAGERLVITDRFADGKLKVFHATACNRYEVKIEPARETAGNPEAGTA